jgi:hypothetical protein
LRVLAAANVIQRPILIASSTQDLFRHGPGECIAAEHYTHSSQGIYYLGTVQCTVYRPSL